ncbi:MAG: ABC transporter substrate-binding protein [Actinomycetaceae bacterium]|nr:ABC transporter substrate-binding protein [Actinomycetaceae bacterium]
MRKLTFAAVAVASLTLSACSTVSPAADAGEIADGFPVTVKHSAGETEIANKPSSIVVFDMAALDTLDALGVGERVVGVPVTSVPTWLKDDDGIDYSELANVGTLKEPDLEAVAKLNPDLVILGSRSASFYEEFSAAFTTLDASVSWENGDYSAEVTDSIRMLGEATGEADRAGELAAKIEEETASYMGTAEGLGTAMVLMTSGGEVSMHSPKSRWAPIFDVFGFKPVSEGAAEEGHKGQKISFETVRELNPDYIFVVDRDAAVGQTEAGKTAQQVLDNELVAETNAAKSGNIHYLSSERWYIVMTGASNYLEELGEIADAIQ